ncbi:hypothetical protein [Ornithinibacillus gellani]|uniref:hypothetical protein n=1 Tax=Ornithinibacillus gellani TaxID=2293253 RepID=UPI0016817A86|nr:hypothetical protein [Ornithinibacillus gellani]
MKDSLFHYQAENDWNYRKSRFTKLYTKQKDDSKTINKYLFTVLSVFTGKR